MNYNPYFDGYRGQNDEPVSDDEYNEVDQNGRRYRKVGSCIEYEPEINGMPRSVFFRSQAAQKQQAEERRKQEAQQMQEEAKLRNCPFKEARNNVHTKCDRDCVFFEDTTCMLASIGRQPTKDTKGSYCPIARMCRETCAFYNHGCTLTCILKGMMPGKE